MLLKLSVALDVLLLLSQIYINKVAIVQDTVHLFSRTYCHCQIQIHLVQGADYNDLYRRAGAASLTL